jgi:flagellar FliJ protein
MGYHFNLEPLLDHRKFIEESKQRDFALMQQKFNQAKNRLVDLRNNKIKLYQDFKKRLQSSVQPYEFTMYQSYAARLKYEIEQQKEIINKIEKQVNTARIALLSAMKDRKTLEKIKEKRKENYMRKMAKKEQTLLNEAALLRFNRKKQR